MVRTRNLMDLRYLGGWGGGGELRPNTKHDDIKLLSPHHRERYVPYKKKSCLLHHFEFVFIIN